ncbi:MAG: mechanosensitive ion channel family protein [Bacteroidales bacterium]|nr:mechanosensitive ion channel family protein [Bacteroidales bacterium]
MEQYVQQLKDFLTEWLGKTGISDTLATYSGEFITLILLVLAAYIGYVVSWKLMRKILLPLFQRSKNQFDDLLVKHSFFRRISYLVPALILYYFIDDALFSQKIVTTFIERLLEVFFVFNIVLVLDSVLSTVNDFYSRFDFAKDHPIKGLIQILKIVLYLVAGMIVIGVLFDRDISTLALSLGTMSAVIMLIFKDPILGFVGGLQLIFNKMLSIGDWITVPKYGADGTVLELNLTTVKVQNWDKTIVTLPTYSLITDSFQNWRGMEDSGGRRIKRSINIDMDSIGFCSQEMLNRFRKIHVLRTYIDETEKLVNDYNEKHKIDPSVLVNGRRQTNIGVFRAYLKAYLHNRTDIHDDMTFLVRQLQPSEKGLPVQIYVFAKTIEWAEYEDVQADIFDHILAVIPQFGLKVYQFPKSGDFAGMSAKG